MNDQIADALRNRINELLRQSETLQSYLEMKVRQSDWHGVSDAANDLREIETEIDGVRYALVEMGF